MANTETGLDPNNRVIKRLWWTEITWVATWQKQQNECAHSNDSDQPWHPPSLIRVFAVRMKKALVLSYPLSAQQRHWSDWADAQADLSLRWAHSHFVGFVMSRLTFKLRILSWVLGASTLKIILWDHCTASLMALKIYFSIPYHVYEFTLHLTHISLVSLFRGPKMQRLIRVYNVC